MYYWKITLGWVFARLIVCIISLSLILQSLPALAGEAASFSLPKPGAMVALSAPFSPVVLKGIKLDPQNPFRFHFYVDQGDSSVTKEESQRLIKYFLASLTISEKDLWVNLSPYEKDRIIPEAFGQTEMGRDLLAQDYILKQITASLIYPESQMGKQFWDKVYKEAKEKYGTTEIPINTFNKVWIMPEKAVVYENNGTAYVLENHLKVMLEQDYLAFQKNTVIPAKAGIQNKNNINTIGTEIVREIIIPALTKEVNEGKNFAQLRQVFYSLILATWYKNKIKDGILNKVYSDKNKILNLSFPNASIGDPEHIYQEYLKAFKKGVFNYIKEDVIDFLPRKYFSGGVIGAPNIKYVSPAMISPAQARYISQAMLVEVDGVVTMHSNQAMSADGDRAMAGKRLRLDNNVGEKSIEQALKLIISDRTLRRTVAKKIRKVLDSKAGAVQWVDLQVGGLSDQQFKQLGDVFILPGVGEGQPLLTRRGMLLGLAISAIGAAVGVGLWKSKHPLLYPVNFHFVFNSHQGVKQVQQVIDALAKAPRDRKKILLLEDFPPLEDFSFLINAMMNDAKRLDALDRGPNGRNFLEKINLGGISSLLGLSPQASLEVVLARLAEDKALFQQADAQQVLTNSYLRQRAEVYVKRLRQIKQASAARGAVHYGDPQADKIWALGIERYQPMLVKEDITVDAILMDGASVRFKMEAEKAFLNKDMDTYLKKTQAYMEAQHKASQLRDDIIADQLRALGRDEKNKGATIIIYRGELHHRTLEKHLKELQQGASDFQEEFESSFHQNPQNLSLIEFLVLSRIKNGVYHPEIPIDPDHLKLLFLEGRLSGTFSPRSGVAFELKKTAGDIAIEKYYPKLRNILLRLKGDALEKVVKDIQDNPLGSNPNPLFLSIYILEQLKKSGVASSEEINELFYAASYVDKGRDIEVQLELPSKRIEYFTFQKPMKPADKAMAVEIDDGLDKSKDAAMKSAFDADAVRELEDIFDEVLTHKDLYYLGEYEAGGMYLEGSIAGIPKILDNKRQELLGLLGAYPPGIVAIHNTRKEFVPAILDEGIKPSGDMGIPLVTYDFKTPGSIRGLAQAAGSFLGLEVEGWVGSVRLDELSAVIVDLKDRRASEAKYIYQSEGSDGFRWKHHYGMNEMPVLFDVDLSITEEVLDGVVDAYMAKKPELALALNGRITPDDVHQRLRQMALVYIWLNRLIEAFGKYNSAAKVEASGANTKLLNPVSRSSFAEGEARVKQLTGNSLMKHLYKRGDVELDAVVEFVKKDHPLKIKIFDRLDKMKDGEVLAEMQRVLALPHANDVGEEAIERGAYKGLHLYSAISLRELLLHSTYGREDMRQLLGGLGNYASSELEGYKEDKWVLVLIEHTYLLFRAIEVFSRQFSWDLFSKEDLDKQGGLLDYLIEFGSYEDEIRRFLNFSSDVLIERLDNQDMRPSIENFFALLDKLQQTDWPNEAFNANAKEWQRVLSLNEPYRDNIEKLKAALKPTNAIMSANPANAAMGVGRGAGEREMRLEGVDSALQQARQLEQVRKIHHVFRELLDAYGETPKYKEADLIKKVKFFNGKRLKVLAFSLMVSTAIAALPVIYNAPQEHGIGALINIIILGFTGSQGILFFLAGGFQVKGLDLMMIREESPFIEIAHEVTHMLRLPRHNFFANTYGILIANKLGEYDKFEWEKEDKLWAKVIYEKFPGSLKDQETLLRTLLKSKGYIRRGLLLVSDEDEIVNALKHARSVITQQDQSLPKSSDEESWHYDYGRIMAYLALKHYPNPNDALRHVYELSRESNIHRVQSDAAMRAKGGIDMNPAQMSLQVKNEGEGFHFDFNGVDIDAAQVTGAEFIINEIKPVTNLPMELGLPAA